MIVSAVFIQQAIGDVYGTVSGGMRPTALLRPPRLPHQIVAGSSPQRDAPIRILALRVEFVPDSLATTTGAGEFDYGYADTNYFDPPPHDSLYFADNLEFLRYYWSEMSNGALADMEWNVYPPGDRASYRLPKQMWQYNWNSGEAQLNLGLSELFRDAVTAADTASGIQWQDYDLVMVFHAGAGAEFDLGYNTTPHDLPSAWMVPEDFRRYLNLPNGIPVNDSTGYVTSGLILPETESREGVQISMLGVLCSLFGHWLGLPALYDQDGAKPVVGKWSLMDRGFGNFYGAIPGELDAWSRSYKGWITPVEAAAGDLSVAVRGFAGAGSAEAYRVPITTSEYFLLECRNRDPENDSVAIGYDREGRRMVFKEDYTVDYDPGFRVPVRIDNLDFDSPGSGILIWHVDESLEPLIAEGRFNSVDERRGLDLEEADGAQDIGQNYPFLTPGYGTDYGIFEDAWHRGNEANQAANHHTQVSFDDDSYPNSRANSGAFTHITLDNFSPRGTEMGLKYQQSGWLLSRPVPFGIRARVVVVGNFDADPSQQEIIAFDTSEAKVFRGDGSVLDDISFEWNFEQVDHNPLVRDLDGDGRDEVIWMAMESNWTVHLLLLKNVELHSVDTLNHYNGVTRANSLFVGSALETELILAFEERDPISGFHTIVRTYDRELNQQAETEFEEPSASFHRYGTPSSDTTLIVTVEGTAYWLIEGELLTLGKMFENWPEMRYFVGNSPCLVDVDGNGLQDLYALYTDIYGTNEGEGGQASVVRGAVWYDIGKTNPPKVEPLTLPTGLYEDISFQMPIDIDNDGANELLISERSFISGFRLTVLEQNGVLSGFPITPCKERTSAIMAGDILGDGSLEFVVTTYYSPGIALKNRQMEDLPGYPIATRIDHPKYTLCQLDNEPGLELLVSNESEFDLLDLGYSGPEMPNIWWGQPFRDNDHSNAIWEPARPFSPAPGASLMPSDLCYNWPNPAREQTAIRYFLNRPASVRIDIFDVVGEKVTSLFGPGQAGMDNEVIWDLTRVPYGAYIAHVEATGDGKKETKLVKIAVVK